MTEPEIRQEIERTRAQLGATVAELAARADVTARARDKAADVKAKARATASGLVRRRWPLALAIGVAAAAVSAAIWRHQKA
jgi:hypothetical protein